jgi:hypothetical protein
MTVWQRKRAPTAPLKWFCTFALPLLLPVMAACVAALFFTAPALAQTVPPQFVYAAVESTQNIFAYQLNPANGVLTPVPGSPFFERLDPCKLAVDPAAKFLFVANCSTNDVSVFQINQTTGALIEAANSPFSAGLGTNPAFLATDPTGQFLYVANGQMISDATSGDLDGYSIDPVSGALTPIPNGAGLWAPSYPEGMYVPPTGGIYIAGDYELETYSILQFYTTDSVTGVPSAGSSDDEGQEYFRCLAPDPAGPYLFAALAEYEGDLETFSGLTSVFGSAGTQLQYVSYIGVDWTGSFLYTDVRGTFSIDKSTGSLTQINATNSSGPMVTDPLGPYMLLDGVSVYQVDPITGDLTLVPNNSSAVTDSSGVKESSGVNDGDAVAVVITGTAPQNPTPMAAFSPASLTFGNEYLGASGTPQTIQIVNTGTAALDISATSIDGTGSTDFSETNNCPASLNAGASCSFNVTFTPSVAGARTATLTVTDNATGSPQEAILSGTGVTPAPAVSIIPNTYAFPSTDVGSTSASQNFTLTNSGAATLAISSIVLGGPNPGDFTETNACGASLSAGASCTITATFVPQAAGSRTATVSITDNAPDSPETIALSGTGNEPFSLAPTQTGGNSLSMSPTGSATYNLQFMPGANFTGTVSVACTGAPAGANCLVNPGSFQSSGAASIPVSVVVSPSVVASSMTTTAIPLSVGNPWARNLPPLRLVPVGVFSLIVFSLFLQTRNQRMQIIPLARLRFSHFALATVAASMLIASACGGSGGGQTTPPPQTGIQTGQYTITIVATSGSASQNIALTLNVTTSQ